jgi:hypothetical protein
MRLPVGYMKRYKSLHCMQPRRKGTAHLHTEIEIIVRTVTQSVHV